MASRRGFSRFRMGCLFLLLSILAACAMLIVNGLVVSFVLGSAAARLPDFMRQPRVVQALLFLGPVLLLAVEWWAYDVLTDWIFPLRRPPRQRNA